MATESLLPVIELFPGPALVVGPGGEILGANDRAVRWIGMDRDGLVGRPLAGFVADSPESVAGLLEASARGGKAAGRLTPSPGRGQGGECRVEAVSVPSRCRAGELAAVVVHVVSRVPDAEGPPADEGPDLVDQLREELRRRDEFMNRLAHDLRNPVAAISGALHVARRATSPEDVAWAGDTMERQLHVLVRQLDDLLDLSRLARGRVVLKRQRLDAAAMARSAAAAIRPTIDQRGQQLVVSMAPGCPAVDADPARLGQLLGGLLGHVAGSVEPGGQIRLSVAPEPGTVAFRVRDRAADPIPPQASDPPASECPVDAEPGVGLMLVRKLAELHGGSATVRGQGPDAGREFIVRLPAADAPGPVAGTPPARTGAARILVVDDNVDTARATARLLEMAGHDVRIAHDGRQALELADSHRPRIILLDIGLPVMDGYEVARQLRGDPRHRDTTIIAVSGYSQDDYRPDSDAGFDHHLVKPLDFEALRAILDRTAGGDG